MFPWMNVSNSIHNALAHSAQIMRENNGRGLAQLSEAPLEAQQKFVRRVRTNLSRKTSEEESNVDVMTRLTIRTEPFVRKVAPKKKTVVSNITFTYDVDKLVKSFLILEDLPTEE